MNEDMEELMNYVHQHGLFEGGLWYPFYNR